MNVPDVYQNTCFEAMEFTAVILIQIYVYFTLRVRLILSIYIA